MNYGTGPKTLFCHYLQSQSCWKWIQISKYSSCNSHIWFKDLFILFIQQNSYHIYYYLILFLSLDRIIYLTLKLLIQSVQSTVVPLSLYFSVFLSRILPFKKFLTERTPLRLFVIAPWWNLGNHAMWDGSHFYHDKS